MNDHSGGGGRLDLAAIRASADLVDIAGRYLKLRKRGKEHEALCPFHADTDPSLSIYTSKKDGIDRFWCPACDAKGDAIDFVARIERVDVIDAARIIAGRIGPIAPIERKAPPPPDWIAILPVPDNAPAMNPADLWNPKREGSRGRDGKPYAGTFLRPTRRDEYRDAAGELLGYVLRCDIEGEKWTPQVTYCRHRTTGELKWCLQAFPEPRPMQGLDELARRPGDRVLVVSGEKCRAVAAEHLPGFVAVTWPGGDNGWTKVDMTPLHSRQVTFWPDADASGLHAMRMIAATLSGSSVRFLDASTLVEQFGKGADIADLIAAGWNREHVTTWARANLIEGIPAEPVEPVEPANPTPQTATASEEAVDVIEPGRGPDSTSPSGKGGEAIDLASTARHEPSAHDAPDATPPREPDQAPEQPEKIPARTRKKRGAELLDTPAQSSASYESLTTWSALGLQMSDKGVPHPNLDNAARVLERHSEMRGRFWFDEFQQRILSTWNPDDEPREWTDSDDVRLTLWLQRKVGMGKMATGTARDAVTATAMALRRNELREWLECLTWDQTPRLDELMHAGFAAERNPYTQAVGRCWLVSLVARALDPGCKVDTMPVFEGEQGERKSSALELLVGQHWFAEAAEDPRQKDFFANMSGKWLIEIGEMDAFSRSDLTTIKRVVSCKVDRYRAPYGRRSEDHPRASVFAGTTNKDNWNRDETGARRFWPIACRGKLGHEWIAANREQLFAEAVARYEAGESWWDVPAADAKREQDARREVDAWEGLIDDYLIGRWDTTAEELMAKCLQLPAERWEKATQMRIASCLRALGWKAGQKWKGGKNVRCWLSPNQPTAQPTAEDGREIL